MNNSPSVFIGNLTKDPDVTVLGGGTTKLSFGIAVNHSYKKNDEWVEETSFFNVIAWRKVAEDAATLLQKGLGVIVSGRLIQRSYETPEGDKRYVVELIADSIAIQARSVDSFVRKQSTGGAREKVSASAGVDDAPF